MSMPPAKPVFRALTLFDELPPRHKTFAVTTDDSEPHLKAGEFAVIDTFDRQVQHGELYLVQWNPGVREIVHVRARRQSIRLSQDAAFTEEVVWYVGDLRGFRRLGETRGDGSPVYVGVSDGPYLAERLQSKLIGRVIGYAMSSLGGVLAAMGDARRE